MKNKKNQHTKGPWRVVAPKDGLNIEGHAVTADLHTGRYVIAEMRGPISFDEDWANAHLIAAAPDMLEALELAVSTIEKDNPEIRFLKEHTSDFNVPPTYLEQILPVLKKAIAKARGEQ